MARTLGGRGTGATTTRGGSKTGAIPAPTALAVVKSAEGKEQIVVADELSDDVLLVDTASGKIETRFDLADHVVVKGAAYTDGLLTIDLAREVPEAMRPRRIAIWRHARRLVN